MPSQSLLFRFIGIDDGASAQFDRMAAKADMTAASLKRFGIGAAVVFGVIAVESIKSAAKFQQSTELLVTQAGLSQKALGGMREGILSLSGQVAASPEALSEALFHIVSTGQRGAAALNELKIAAEGAKVGGADLTDVTNALNATIVSGIKGAGNFSQAMGALNAIVGAGDMHMQDLANALGSGVLAVVKTFGVNLTQAGAALAVFGDNNIRGAQAATYLRQAVQSISDPSATAALSLAKIHTTVAELQDALAKGGLTGALDLLHTKFEDSGIAANKWGDILEGAFTKKAGTGITILLEQFGRYELKQAEIRQGAQSFGDDWSATTKNLSFQFDRLQADVQVLAVKLGDELLPVAMGVIHGFIDMGDAVKATADFFLEHKTETVALGAALTGVLLPGLIATGAAMASDAYVSFGILLLRAKEAVLGFAAAEDTAAVSTDGWLATMGPIGITLAVLGAVGAATWEHSQQETKKATDAANAYVQSLHVSTNSLASLGQGVSSISSKMKPLTADIQDQAKAGNVLAEGQLIARSGYGALLGSLESYKAQQVTVTANEKKIAAAYGLTRPQVEQLASANGIDLTGSLQSVDDGFTKLTASANLSKSPLKDASANFGDMAQSTTTAAQGLTAMGNAFNDLVGNFVSLKQAQLDYKNDLVSLDAALKKSHDSISLNTAAGRAARGQYLSLVSQIETVTSATYTSSKSYDAAKKSAQTMLGQLEQLPIKGPAVRKIIQGLKADIQGMGNAALTGGKDLGTNLDKGLMQGMEALVPQVGAAAKQVLQAALNNMHKTGVFGSPSKITTQYGKWLAEGLLDGWTGEAAKIKDALGTGLQDALEHMQTVLNNMLSKQKTALKSAQSTLHQALVSRNQDIKSLSGSISGGADISGIFGTDANGNATVGNAQLFLQSQVGPLKQEAAILAKLKARHMKAGLLAEIANLPPAEAIEVGQQFLSGQSSIAAANQAFNQITSYSTASAKTVEDALTAHAIDKDRAEVKKQTHILEEVRKDIHKMAEEAGRGTAREITFKVDGKELKLTNADGLAILRLLHRIEKTQRAGKS